MAIDPRIALGVQPAQIQSPLETTANVLQLQAMQQRNALAQRQFEAEQATAAREAERQMRLGAFLDVNRGNNLLDPAKAARMLALGGGEELQRLINAQTTNLAGQKQAAELPMTIWNGLRERLASLDPTDPNAWRAFRQQVGQVASWALAFIPEQGSEKAKLQVLTTADKALPKLESMNLNGRQILYQPFTGEERASFAETPSYSDVTARQRVALDRDKAAREAAQPPASTSKIDKVVTDEAGRTRFFSAEGREIIPTTAEGKPTVVGGKPSATFEKTRAQKAQLKKDLALGIAQLKTALEPGGLLETATGSGIGALVDATAGFFGQPTEGSRAIARLRPLADIVLKLVPRFEGPQSEKDVISYNQAAGLLADPTTPNEDRIDAAKEILRLYELRGNQFGYADMFGGAGEDAGDGVDTSNPLLQ